MQQNNQTVHGNQQRRTASSSGRQQQPRTPTQPREKGSRWFRAILMVLATLTGCFFLAMFLLQSASDLFGLNQDDKQIEVTVPAKSSIQDVASLLYYKGIVSQPLTFRLYASFKTDDKNIQPGNYIFNSNFSYDQVIYALEEGTTKKEVVRVTFIEGENIYEIAKRLEENDVCDADKFLEYTQSGDIDYEFVNQIPTDPLRYYRLEGYMFPDTYEFYKGMDVALVADKFLDNFDKRVTEEMRSKMNDKNLSLDEAISLASIVQKEAGEAFEMKTVAAVFLNRLSNKETYPTLQSDVTIHYVDYFIKPFLSMQNQPQYDAYNTYKCEGLPVGAICNPGLDAINAVLEPDPDAEDFYFFVTDTEGTYYYAKTAQQHYANVTKAAAVGGNKIHGTTTITETQ